MDTDGHGFKDESRQLWHEFDEWTQIDAGKNPAHIRRIMARRKKTSLAETRKRIDAARGSIKFDTGGKTFSKWWADHKREEQELDEHRFQRLAALGGEKPPR